MDKFALKDILFGSIQEMSRNKKLYHKGIGQEYSHWTEDGQVALQTFMNMIAYEILEAEELDLKGRAKAMVINGLKGEKT